MTKMKKKAYLVLPLLNLGSYSGCEFLEPSLVDSSHISRSTLSDFQKIEKQIIEHSIQSRHFLLSKWFINRYFLLESCEVFSGTYAILLRISPKKTKRWTNFGDCTSNRKTFQEEYARNPSPTGTIIRRFSSRDLEHPNTDFCCPTPPHSWTAFTPSTPENYVTSSLITGISLMGISLDREVSESVAG